jgi:hypothetical protein
MSEKDRITQPTMGSNDLGSDTPEKRGSGLPSGTDTQTRLAALSTEKKTGSDINDDEKVIKNSDGKTEFLEDNGFSEEDDDVEDDDETDEFLEEDDDDDDDDDDDEDDDDDDEDDDDEIDE